MTNVPDLFDMPQRGEGLGLGSAFSIWERQPQSQRAQKVKLALATVVLVVLVVDGYPAVGVAQVPQISITNSCVWFEQLANGGDGYL